MTTTKRERGWQDEDMSWRMAEETRYLDEDEATLDEDPRLDADDRRLHTHKTTRRAWREAAHQARGLA